MQVVCHLIGESLKPWAQASPSMGVKSQWLSSLKECPGHSAKMLCT